MAALLDLVVRIVHLLGMVSIVGGAAFLRYALHPRAEYVMQPLRDYEWLFWGVLGVLFVTGIGNIAAQGAPSPTTRWGTVLTGKLLLVLALVLGSFPRTLAVQRLEHDDDRRNTRVASLRRLYGATTLLSVAIVILAEVMAHG